MEKNKRIDIYKKLILPRLIEDKMLILLRQGKISKWFSGFGQEAISVGTTCAMDKDEFILPMHRNLGVFTSRNIDLYQLFCQFQGKLDGFTKGRDRSFHFGSIQHKIVGMISHLGPQLGIACGIALAEKLEKTNRSVLVFSGILAPIKWAPRFSDFIVSNPSASNLLQSLLLRHPSVFSIFATPQLSNCSSARLTPGVSAKFARSPMS